MKKPSRKPKSKTHKKIGLPPGSHVYFGDKEDRETFSIEVYDYNAKSYQKIHIEKISDLKNILLNQNIKWINVNGLNKIDKIKEIGQIFELHPLYIEDVLNTNHRPKLEEIPGPKLFLVLKMMYPGEGDEIVIEHLAMFLGKDYVITFQETEQDVFDSLRRRIEEPLGIIRNKKADYLLFALLDAVIDHYFLILEILGDKIEVLENKSVTDEGKEIMAQIQALKRNTLKIRRAITPVREVVGSLYRSSLPLIDTDTQKYFRDLHDHMTQIIESTETYRDMIWGLMELYMSNVSFRINNVMKLLTTISTVFIPLTFIVGIYGMNFDYMPELRQPWGYFTVLLVMLVIAVFMLIYFKRKKWL